MSEKSEAWSTVRIAMRGVGTEPEQLARAAERLEGLAALLADREDVGGVETRDPSLITEGPDFVAVERPELIAYSIPSWRAGVEAAAASLAAGLHLDVEVSGEDHEGDDWRDAWKRYYRSLYFRADSNPACAFMIRPSWIPRREDDPQLELVLDPGRAFGTGLHESTRLCLQALVEFASEGFSPEALLDLGCGSGILGLAALRLWPELARAAFFDHDPEAVATTRENAELNGLGEDPRLAHDTLDLLGASAPSLEPAQLVLANIRPRVLIPAAPALIAALAPRGRLVLSGILDEEAEQVLAPYSGALSLLQRRSDTGWTCLVMAHAAERGA